MGEKKRREAAMKNSAPRTVGSILDGTSEGVFGVVGEIGKFFTIQGWFHVAEVTLSSPIGLPICGCGFGEPHAGAILAVPPCGEGEVLRQLSKVRDWVESGRLVEVVGDVVRDNYEVNLTSGAKGTMPLISCFPYFGGVSRKTTVPSRKMLISDHCKACPVLAA